MRRADRLFQIVQHLRGGRLVTAAMLADRLEVSQRTIYRDIADLMSTGVPIEGEAGVGYLMRDGYDLPPLMFTADEIVALVAGARMIRAWGGAQMAASAEEALIKIGAVLPDDARQRAEAVQIHAFQMPYLTDEDRARIDQLEQATNERIRLSIDYEDDAGKQTRRTIRPLGLWFWGRTWTLIAWCELRNDFRSFRIDRILVEAEGERFKPERDKSLATFYARQERPPTTRP